MAREPVVAVDFLGLGTSMRELDTDLRAEKERGKLVKPTGSLPVVSDPGSARVSVGDDELEIPRPRLVVGTDRSHSSGPLTFSLSQAMPWASLPGKVEEMERSGLAVSPGEEKRVEELSDADIMQLSGDECRRYMMMIKKERGEYFLRSDVRTAFFVWSHWLDLLHEGAFGIAGRWRSCVWAFVNLDPN